MIYLAKLHKIQPLCFKEKGELYETSPFGPRIHPITGKQESMHSGFDCTRWNGSYSDFGTVVAIAPGTVSEVWDKETSNSGYQDSRGNFVRIEHADGYHTRYYHMKQGLYVKVGDKVEQGTPIGYMGNTGASTGAHLHLEVRKDNVAIDPLPFLLGEKKIPEATEPAKPITEFQIGDIVRITGTHYQVEKKVPAWVKAKLWKVSKVLGDIVWVNESTDGQNAINSPFWSKDLELVEAVNPKPEPVAPPEQSEENPVEDERPVDPMFCKNCPVKTILEMLKKIP